MGLLDTPYWLRIAVLVKRECLGVGLFLWGKSGPGFSESLEQSHNRLRRDIHSLGDFFDGSSVFVR